jgi:hypothetical protein
VSIKSELAKVRQLAAKAQSSPAAWATNRAHYLDQCAAWKSRFIDGGPDAAGPYPVARGSVQPLNAEAQRFEEMMLKAGACFIARVERRIGPIAFLPGMKAADKACVDWQCATFWRVEHALAIRAGTVLPDDVYPAEWATLPSGPGYQSMQMFRQAYEAAEAEEIRNLTDAELAEQLALAKARCAELDATPARTVKSKPK